jgi:hypothetical protein
MQTEFTQTADDREEYFGYLHEIECKPHSVMCDICDAEDRGTEKELRRRGWELGPGFEICPFHE